MIIKQVMPPEIVESTFGLAVTDPGKYGGEGYLVNELDLIVTAILGSLLLLKQGITFWQSRHDITKADDSTNKTNQGQKSVNDVNDRNGQSQAPRKSRSVQNIRD